MMLRGLWTAPQLWSFNTLETWENIFICFAESRTTLVVIHVSPMCYLSVPQESHITATAIQHTKQLHVPQDSWRGAKTAMLLKSQELLLCSPVLTWKSPARKYTILGLKFVPQRRDVYVMLCHIT